jgi:hypothetical protein
MHRSIRKTSAPIAGDYDHSHQRADRPRPTRSFKYISLLLLSWGLALAILAFVLTALESQQTNPIASTALAESTVTITAAGCDADQIRIPAIRATQLTVSNTAAEPMVLTIPSLDAMLTVAPGQLATLDLPALPSGSFAFACLTAGDHQALEASVARGAFICGLDVNIIHRRALTNGILLVGPLPG